MMFGEVYTVFLKGLDVDAARIYGVGLDIKNLYSLFLLAPISSSAGFCSTHLLTKSQRPTAMGTDIVCCWELLACLLHVWCRRWREALGVWGNTLHDLTALLRDRTSHINIEEGLSRGGLKTARLIFPSYGTHQDTLRSTFENCQYKKVSP